MLINRTIDRPKEKFDFFLQFLRENKMSYETNKNKRNILRLTQYYVEEKKLCQILKVTKTTLRKWSTRDNVLNWSGDLYHQIELRCNYDIKVFNSTRSTVFQDINKKRRFYNTLDVYLFLVNELQRNDIYNT